ncbi:MAG: YegS/Rv2252/BmrU family lipid kinase [Timaviella obliquedivisa GSE-PSE-MK23-08B]|jgi:YegS/Rv2252/BmrU family lipid kinase|nr:YegS/Rv2252/BmrU family lipid kinase [Timaviella obliquedivisa GSE-PSE-MK23-08B]
MLRSACLIFNPVAGQGDSEQELALICSILQPTIALDIRFTTPETDAATLAHQAVQEGVEAIIASGGDGTISAATAALAGTEIPLGIISRGTANAFANALELPTAIDEACHTILGGATRTVDTATCNGMPMVLLAGIGFEAETVDLADRDSKDRLGMLAYVLAGIEQLRRLNHFDVEIETEDKIINVTASAITIANAAPPTSILAQGSAGVIFDDGLLDLTIVSPATKVKAIAASYDLLTSALRGDAVQREDVGYLRARRFRVTTNPPQKVVLDGEIIGDTPIDVECLPQSLRVFAPQVEEVQPIEKLTGLPNLTVTIKETHEEE